MVKKSVFCIAAYRNAGELIVDQLRFYGISNRDISALYPELAHNGPKIHHFGSTPHHAATEGMLTGAWTRAVIGGTLGWIMGIRALALPGVGAFIAAGPLVALLSGAAAGATMGGIAGALIEKAAGASGEAL